MEFVGKTVKKQVKGAGVVSGTVKSCDPSSRFAEIVYEHGDSEQLEANDVPALLQDEPEVGKVKRRLGRKPTKRRRVELKQEVGAVSGNDSQNLVNSRPNDSEFRGDLGENISSSGNLTVNGELDFELKGNQAMGTGNGGNLICDIEVAPNVNRSVSLNWGVEFLGKESGLEENLKEGIFANGNLMKNDSVKDGFDLNARINLNEDLNLNDGCGLCVDTGGSLERRNIDLNLDANNLFDVNVNMAGFDCSAVGTRRECYFDLNVEVCDEVKETEADDAEVENPEVAALCGKMGQSHKGGADVSQKCAEDDNVSGTLNDITNEIRLNKIHGSPEHTNKDASLSLIGGKEEHLDSGDVAAIDSLGVSNAISVKGVDSAEAQRNCCSSEACIAIDHEYQDDPGSLCKQGSNRRKRRKLSENLKTPTDTVLRRSSRRASARKHLPGTISSHAMDDWALSPGPSTVTEEKPMISDSEQYEQHAVLLPRLQLPPPSQNLNLDDIPVLGLFSIFSCLRSFSTMLFLSPFDLEDFVAALKCGSPSILLDNIHVSVLQTLRKHLEYLSNEGCQSASACLRNLNWDLLDLVTWPTFMAEYLLIHGSGFKLSFDLKMLGGDYHKQPASVKIEILQSLCDDMMEAETIRAELNRRSLVTDTDMSYDQSMYFDICKKRRPVMDVSGGFCLTEDIVDDTTDWNSDECCLCKMDGNLICCDGCPNAFHSRCVGIANEHLPEGDWYCPECIIGRNNPWMKRQKTIRGADLLGIDPHGCLYFNSCGYLLVSDSSDMGSLFNYYHRNDLNVVIEVLKSAGTSYGGILMAIYRQWNIPVSSSAGGSKLNVLNYDVSENMPLMGEYSAASLAPFTPPEICLDKNEARCHRKLEENSTVVQDFSKARNQLDSVTTIASPCVASKGLAETPQVRLGFEKLKTYGPHDLNRSNESFNRSGLHKKHYRAADGSLNAPSTLSAHNWVTSELPCRIDYINCYSFACTPSLVAEDLMGKSREKKNKNLVMTEEDIISEQAKVIMKKSTKFCWPNIQNLNADAQKEKCGWCFVCRVANDDRDCVFTSVVGSVQEVPKSNLVGLQHRRNLNSHLRDVIYYILSLEHRLCGLLSGPWLNCNQTKLWCKDLLKAPDISSVKWLLLTLESNLRHLALSEDWLKPADSVVTVGSASHIVVSSSRTSRNGIGRKRARFSDIDSNSSSNTSGGLGIYWWRGGRLSRHLFNWKGLPRSLATKAARKGGCTKIPGILYLENSDFARRSKYVSWQAAVETSASVEQLAFQVRELDSYIRWHDIENTYPPYVLDKESKKSSRLFKKAIVRRKCTEGESVKYLLDFGKRRAIPDIVSRYGSLLEESSSERKKYWLDESYVPLHLLKNFEEKRIFRKSNDMKSGKLLGLGRVNKVTHQSGFSYLFSRLERSDYHQCGHCKKDVPTREAESCQYCKGYFHKRHIRKSGGTISSECKYSCHKCENGMCVKTDTKGRKAGSKLAKVQAQKSKKASPVCRPEKKSGKKLSKGRQVKSQNKKNSQTCIPLRRSARKAKCLSLQSKKKGGRSSGRKNKYRKSTSRKPKVNNAQRKKLAVISERKKRTQVISSYWLNGLKLAVISERKKRTQVISSYWLNGLRLSRKPNDEQVMLFREKNHLASSEGLSGSVDVPKCRLCYGGGHPLNYIACEICGEWFHGDAFGLTLKNASQLIGFRCHLCRSSKTAPICPHTKSSVLSHAENNPPVPPQTLREI